jgi:Spy/CpxP family protein refolding chaperone
MNNRLLSLLLGLSVLFNACFMLGWFGIGNTATADPAERLARSLDLSDRQRMRFDELRTSLDNDTASLHVHVRELRTQLAQTLEQDAPNIDRVRELVAEISTQQMETRVIAAGHLSSFLDLLDPDQRRALGRRLGAAGKRHLPEHLLSSFDTDGNGEIDDEERQNARAAMQLRHEAMREQRKAMAEQFDSDGDGTLNPEERQALREHLLEQGLIPPHRGDGARDGRGNGEGRRRGSGRRGPGPDGAPDSPRDGPPPGHPPGDAPPDHPPTF